METLDFKLLIACQVRMPARPVVAFIMHRDNAPRINDLLHYYPSFSLYTKGRKFSKASHIHLPECSPMVCPEVLGVFTMAVEDVPNIAKKAKL